MFELQIRVAARHAPEIDRYRREPVGKMLPGSAQFAPGRISMTQRQFVLVVVDRDPANSPWKAR